MKNDRLTRIIDIIKNYDLYEKLIEEIEKDLKNQPTERENKVK